MPRKPKNTITINIVLPEQLIDGSYLPSDQSFRDFARIHIDDHITEFLRHSRLIRPRDDFQKEWNAQMGTKLHEQAELENEQEGKRKEVLARQAQAVVAAAIAKVHPHGSSKSPERKTQADETTSQQGRWAKSNVPAVEPKTGRPSAAEQASGAGTKRQEPLKGDTPFNTIKSSLSQDEAVPPGATFDSSAAKAKA